MTAQTGRSPAPVEDRSIAQLVQDLSDQMRRLVRDELRLATAELKAKGRRAGVGAGVTGAAGVLALLGGATLVAAAVLALALVLPGWAAALIIGGFLVLVGGIALLVGGSQLKAAIPPLPREAVEGMAKDMQVIREGSRRHGRA
ncbi:phage holin family protein [Amycolatopsis rhizosphaerae]|uniref:Phage holin family protein n=1 Tax=Amycolatopsis rhizosphaerae TaxID=2053003 RepID=A0A558BC22_9PSEU|nr:phage holin family protein [Amycolatopsis rhizosphaerae]TVT34056.1 phage holin family protein [Amycolatopsis rhizosphaerae]